MKEAAEVMTGQSSLDTPLDTLLDTPFFLTVEPTGLFPVRK